MCLGPGSETVIYPQIHENRSSLFTGDPHDRSRKVAFADVKVRQDKQRKAAGLLVPVILADPSSTRPCTRASSSARAVRQRLISRCNPICCLQHFLGMNCLTLSQYECVTIIQRGIKSRKCIHYAMITNVGIKWLARLFNACFIAGEIPT